MVKAVIFDIDGTLYDYAANDKLAVQSLCAFAENVLNVDKQDFIKVYCEARRIVKEERLIDGGARHSRVLFFQTALELLGKNPFRYIIDMYNTYWNIFLTGMEPFDGAVEFICKLHSAGIKIALCTDMTAHIQYRKIERLGLCEFMDAMVTSEETGLEKPARMMFELALKKLNVRAEDAAYFGDSLERDIKGAVQVGIKPFWYIRDRIVEDTDINCVKVRSYREMIDSEIFF